MRQFLYIKYLHNSLHYHLTRKLYSHSPDLIIRMLECLHVYTCCSVEQLLKREHDLSLYISDFEASFLDRSRKYYEAKAARWREDSVRSWA